MIILVFTIVFVMCFLFCWYMYKKKHLTNPYNDWVCASVICAVLSIVCGVLGFAFNTGRIIGDLDDTEGLVASHEIQDVAEERKEHELKELSEYLIEFYPTYEKEVLETINRGDLQILLRFPDLKTNQTVLEYTNRIKELNTDIYTQLNARIAMRKRMRIRRRNPFVLHFLLPEMPTEQGE